MKFSVVLATFNEEENIARCLDSIRDTADEIIIVDGDSTDSTRNIARKLGAKVFKTTNKPNFHINKQLAINRAKGDWILQLDADEVVDQELKKSIECILSEGSNFNGFWIKRKNWFLNTFLTKGGQYPDKVIRLFKLKKAYLPQKNVHEQIIVDGEVGELEGHLLHYSAPTFKRYITNANRYTSLTAQNLFDLKVSLSPISFINYLLIKPINTFLLIYIRHKGFKDGFPGFIFALFSGLHHALAFMKYWELKNNENKD